MSTIAETLDAWLQSERVKDKAERRKGCISPSSLGQCYRRQYWTRRGEVESNPIPLETLRVFKAGDLTHELIQSLYPEAMREVEVVLDDDVYGHADLVFEDEVVDIKSCGSFQFKKFAKMTAEQFAEEKPDYVLQVCAYAYALKKPVGRLCLVNKESWEINDTLAFSLTNFRSRVEAELSRLREIWFVGELPKAEPRLYKGKECTYCAYQTKCEITEGTKVF